jgi:hypothetical protein
MGTHRALAAIGGFSLAVALAACGGASSGGEAAPASPTPSTSSSAIPAIVGQWATQRDCQALHQALVKDGLGNAAAPVVQDYFQSSTPQKLAEKRDICAGAGPAVVHSHFFTATGNFGSLDENEQQVDDGTFSARSPDLYICDSGVPSCTPTNANGHFRYSISNNKLRLTPIITQKQRQKALAHPFDFSQAGWMVAVAYPGHVWTRTGCSAC